MAPIKFEEHIKNKLDERTLKPSANAWDKLSDRLDENQKKDNSKPYWWLGIAASIIGVIFVVSQLTNNKIEQEITPTVVINPEVEKDTVETQVVNATKDAKVILEKNKIVSTNIRKSKNSNTKLNQTETVVENIEVVLNTQNQEKFTTIATIGENKESLTFEEKKIQEVVAQVRELKENKSDVSDIEIETLLAQAQKEIALEKLYNENTGIVDANILLQDVEADLEESFRTRVFEALKESYKSVKTAVVNRNN